MKPYSHTLFRIGTALLACALSLQSYAQTDDDAKNNFRHCIGVKQSFYSWGECSNDKPTFTSAEIKLYAGPVPISVTVANTQ
ncbi:MAG: hypothetical protein QM786_06815 [Breznakibacter sp.]